MTAGPKEVARDEISSGHATLEQLVHLRVGSSDRWRDEDAFDVELRDEYPQDIFIVNLSNMPISLVYHKTSDLDQKLTLNLLSIVGPRFSRLPLEKSNLSAGYCMTRGDLVLADPVPALNPKFSFFFRRA